MNNAVQLQTNNFFFHLFVILPIVHHFMALMSILKRHKTNKTSNGMFEEKFSFFQQCYEEKKEEEEQHIISVTIYIFWLCQMFKSRKVWKTHQHSN